jgi:galactokinase
MSGGGFGGCVIALCEPDSPALEPETHAPRRAWRVSPAAAAARLGT